MWSARLRCSCCALHVGAAHPRAFFSRGVCGSEQGIALFCSLHREDGNVNLQVSRCEVEGCKVTPSYSSPNERYGRSSPALPRAMIC